MSERYTLILRQGAASWTSSTSTPASTAASVVSSSGSASSRWPSSGWSASFINPIAGFVVGIALIYFHVCVQGKRWHDRGKSAWWVLIAFIPLVGAIWVIVECGCLAGSPEPNEYGPAPAGGVTVSPSTT